MKPRPWAAQHPNRDRLHQHGPVVGAGSRGSLPQECEDQRSGGPSLALALEPRGRGEGGGSHGIQVPHSPSQIWFSTPDKYIFSPRPNPPQRGQRRWHLPVTYFPLSPSDPSHLLGWRREGKEWVGGKQVNGELGARSEFQGNTQVVPSL